MAHYKTIPYRFLAFLVKAWLMATAILCLEDASAQQPVAAFTADVVSGCAPLTVVFSDQSTGNPTGWNWDFGNGQLLNNRNNTITYVQPGIYTVKLVVRNADGISSTTRTNLIQVNATPTVAFSVNKVSGCNNTSFHFTDETNLSGDILAARTWNFGDGQTDTTATPDHVYSAEGIYNVSLTVSTQNGCSSTITKYNFVQVAPGVKADFSNSLPISCDAPFLISYTNLSTGQGTLTYNWNLGNGTSSEISPSRNYSAAGNYMIKLVAKSSFGCSDTISRSVSINKITTDFSVSDNCLSSVTSFRNLSGEVPVASAWFFGSGNTSTGLNSSFTFPSASTYAVKLVNTYSACKDSVIKNVVIQNNPVPNFTSGPVTGCESPFAISFQSNTPGANSWNWNFGDGSAASTTPNPSHLYTSMGKFSVTLTVSNAAGCRGSVTKTGLVNIAEPQASVTNAPGGGCLPFSYSPEAVVSSADGISSYSWNFGEGATQTGISPTHIYRSAGTYPLTLTVTTNRGCRKTYSSTVMVGTAASNVDFTSASQSVCPTIPEQFSATSSTPGLSWQWDFGDGQSANGQNPAHSYQDTGYFNIRLSAVNNGCRTTITKNKYIRVLPALARFDFAVDCQSGTKVKFNNTTRTAPEAGTLEYVWDFGDPALPQSREESPEVFFSGPGTYTVNLTVTSSLTGCTNSVSRKVIISAPGADFSIDKNQVCKGAPFSLTSANDPSSVSTYEWTIGTNTPVKADQVYTSTVLTSGRYDVKLLLVDVNGCPHENTQLALITVTGPTASFHNDPVYCGKGPITFKDETISPDQVTTWRWDFGDADTITFSSPPFAHLYSDTGTFPVTMMVMDINGCADTIKRTAALTLNDPHAYFNLDSSSWCPGAAILFSDSSVGNNLTYLWDFGDGGTDNNRNAAHTYPTTDGDYTVSLKVSDYSGCVDSLSRNRLVKIRSPLAAFSLKNSTGICTPLIEEFRFEGTGYQNLTWNFGDGSPPSSELNPEHAYTSFGRYSPSLTVSGNGGCSSMASLEITLTDPATMGFEYVAPETCNSLPVNFVLNPPPGTSYTLFFGDGTSDSSRTLEVNHLYNTPAFYSPYIQLKDSTGCVVSVPGKTEVKIFGANPLFGTGPAEHCDSGTVSFTNYTFSNDPILRYNWDFGNGMTSSLFETSNHYGLPGTYIPKLTVTTQRGCNSSYSDTVKIYRTPEVNIISNDTICLNAVVPFRTSILVSDTVVSYNWSFSDGESSAKAEPVKKFRVPGSMVVGLQTSIPFGCEASTSKPIHITAPPTVGSMNVQSVLAGQSVVLPATYSEKVTAYKWTPASGLDCSSCPRPNASPKNNTTYEVTATDRYGCEGTGEVTVLVTCNNNNFFVPNTFSPNNDGINDHFYPRGTGLVRIASLRIFNRWGEVVFEKKDFDANDENAGWNGTFKGKPAISDVYIYKMEVICQNAVVIPFQGNVFLLR